MFDFGGGKLTGLIGQDPKVVCVREAESEKILDVLERIKYEMRSVVVIDGLGAMLERCSQTSVSTLHELLRSSEGSRRSFLISANGIGITEMNHAMLSHMSVCFALRQQDSFRYMEILGDTTFKGSTQLRPGRGYMRRENRIVEFCVCCLPEE